MRSPAYHHSRLSQEPTQPAILKVHAANIVRRPGLSNKSWAPTKAVVCKFPSS